MKKILIAGGGLSGFISALYVKKVFTNLEVFLIHSPDIGILGAGEGTTPQFKKLLDILEIDKRDFLKKTKGTLKLGIQFDNWNGDKDSYLHGFGEIAFKPKSKDRTEEENRLALIHYGISKSIHLDKLSCIKSLIDNFKSSLFLSNQKQNLTTDSYMDALHLDAHLSAQYFEDIAKSRGIKVIEDKILDFELNQEGYITKVLCDSGTFDCDFVFDCTGFARMIIGKKYDTEWISYKKHLTLDSAFSFQLPIDLKRIKPATIATAMNSGWMWKIPLTYRFGCGYIYDSSFITEEEAVKEVEAHLDTQIKVVNRFKFDAGRYKNSWVKNCCAIGLSSNFTEPLEATSIWLQFLSLHKLMECNFFDLYKDKKIVNDYNKYVADLSDLTMNFLYFHYMTKRSDTPFWKTYSERTSIPKQLKYLIDFWNQKAHTPHDEDMLGDVFGVASYLMVGHGNKFWNKKSSKDYCDVRNLDDVKKFVSDIPKIENFLLDKSITHEDFLRYL